MDQADKQGPPENTGPLAGLRVIDAATVIAGPTIGMLMADFGADVIKVEHPRGDVLRTTGFLKDGVGLWYKMANRNKRGVTLNLSTDEGQALFKRLAATADVVIENFRTGTMEKWGLGWEDLKAINPRRGMVRVTGFGQTGPYRHRPGFGTIAEAFSGFAAATGMPDGPPTLPNFGLADGIAAAYGTFAAMFALYHRDATGAGMMDAKKALEAADGDMEAAKQALREKGLAKADARSDRDNDEGTVAIAVDGNTAAVVQIKTETDFSAKNNAVTTLAQTLADAVLTGGPGAVDAHADAIDDLKVTIKENIELGAVEQIIAADGNILDTYLHSQDGRGVNAVVVEGNGVSQEDLHQVALHVAFAKPTYLSSDEIPADDIEKERVSLLEITKAEGKPEQAWDKIVTGRLNAWKGERALLEQGLHGDKTAVKDSLGGGNIARFVQVVIGS